MPEFDPLGEVTYYDVEPDETGKTPKCNFCEDGHIHLDFGGSTGYQMWCDKCHHTYAVNIV